MYYAKEKLVIEPIWIRAQNKPGFATVDSCFVLLGTRQYGAAENKTPERMPVSLFMLKIYNLIPVPNAHPVTDKLNYGLRKHNPVEKPNYVTELKQLS